MALQRKLRKVEKAIGNMSLIHFQMLNCSAHFCPMFFSNVIFLWPGMETHQWAEGAAMEDVLLTLSIPNRANLKLGVTTRNHY